MTLVHSLTVWYIYVRVVKQNSRRPEIAWLEPVRDMKLQRHLKMRCRSSQTMMAPGLLGSAPSALKHLLSRRRTPQGRPPRLARRQPCLGLFLATSPANSK